MSAADLSDAFLDAWTLDMRGLGLDPLDVARVAYAETGMYQRHPRNAGIGIWPFVPSTLARLGWTGTAEEFTAQSPEAQLPWIVRYLHPYASYLTNDGLVYVATFLPAHLKAAAASDDSYVLTREGDGTGFYESNRILDRNHDGVITVGDLRRHLDIQDQGARYEAIAAALRARGATGSRRVPLLVGIGLPTLAGVALLAWGVWQALKGR